MKRSAARFESIQKLNRRTDKRSTTIDMITFFARELPMDMDSFYRHENDSDTSEKRATCGSSPYDPLEHMEGVPSNEIMVSNQSSAASTVSKGRDQVTTNKLTSNSNDMFSEIMSDMIFQSAEKYNNK